MSSLNNFISKEQVSTISFANNIGRCESQQEFEQLIQDNISQFKSWEDHMTSLMNKNDLTYSMISQKCDLPISTARRYVKEIPPKRKYVIELAILFKFDVLQTNDLLTRWAKYEKLCAKNVEDAIWIFIINSQSCEKPEKEFNELKQRLEDLINEVDSYYRNKPSERKKVIPVGTIIMEDKILSTHTLNEFEKEMSGMVDGFKTRNKRLLDYIDGLVRSYAGNANKLFSQDKRFRDYHYQQLRNLENNESPNRMYLITLGLKLNCTTDGINELLSMAGMSPLCSKDRLESAIYFYLEELYCKCPDSLNGYYNNDEDKFAYDLKNIQDDTEDDFGELKDFFENEDCYNYIVNRLRSTNLGLNIDKLFRE